MAIEATGVENVMEEVAHFWQLRKFQFIEEATDFWMDAVAPKECLGDEDPNLRTALTLNQFFTEWLLFEMPYQESTLVGITALRDEISAESRDVLKQIAETQRFSSFKMQWLNPDTNIYGMAQPNELQTSSRALSAPQRGILDGYGSHF